MADVLGTTTAEMAFSVSLISMEEISFSDTIEVEDTYAPNIVLHIIDQIAIESVFSRVAVELELSISDDISLSDAFRKIITDTLTDTFSLSDSFTISQVVETLADTLGLSDEFVALITAELSFASTLSVEDAYDLRYRLTLADTISIADAISAKIHQILSFLDSIDLSDTYSQTFTMQLTVADSVSLSDTFAEAIQTTLSFSDTIGILGQFALDGETYLVWGMNPRTRAAYRWNLPMRIKGFERIGGKNLIAASDGIYEVTGSDDSGADIDASLKTGFEDFDDPERHFPGEKIKQLLHAYLVLTTDGETMLKVTTTRRGEALETWFKCKEKPSVMSKKVIPLSNSLRSILFQFEIIPLKGKPAKFRELEIIPLFLTRSI